MVLLEITAKQCIHAEFYVLVACSTNLFVVNCHYFHEEVLTYKIFPKPVLFIMGRYNIMN
jgi:hypothetical protein